MTELPAGTPVLRRGLRAARGWTPVLAATELAGVAITAVSPLVLARAVDGLLLRHGGLTGPALLFLALTGAGLGCQALHELAAGSAVAATTASLRTSLIRHLLGARPWAVQRHFTAGDLVSRYTAGAAEAGQAAPGLVGAVSAVGPALAGVAALFVVDPWVGATFVAGVPVLALLMRAFLRDVTGVMGGYQRAQGEIATRLVDALDGRQTIAAAGTVRREADRVLWPLSELRRNGWAMWHAEARISWRASLLVATLVYLVVAVAGVRLAAGRLSPGELVATLQYATMAAGIMGLTQAFGLLSRARAGAGRLAEVLAVPAPPAGTRDLPPGHGRLEFRDVTVGAAWRAADFVLPGGSWVAVVGASGSGKSLLAALAAGLVDPDRGVVSIDGVPLSELDTEARSAAIGYAAERPVLLGDTVADAIAFGLPDPTPATVRRAARAAHADAFIRRLPSGYRAPLAGTGLSGGEVQRLGLARALARPARLLVLDDALSSLDTVTQYRIGAAVRDRRGARTVLVVTHRVGTAARADAVLWLDGDRVRGPAPHATLWRDPRYRAVFQPAPAMTVPSP